MSQALLTTKQVASILGVHVNTVRTMVEAGRINGVKTKGDNGHWRFSMTDVENFMNTNQTQDLTSLLDNALTILDEIPSVLLGQGRQNSALWEFVNKYYGIRSVFGSYAVHAEKEKYRDVIDRKGFVWIGEGSANFMDAYNKNRKKADFITDKFLNSELCFAFGVIKAPSIFGGDTYSLVPLLVVTDNQDKQWVVDGTLQQFYPQIQKGLVVFPLDKAKELYIELKIYHSKEEFAELYQDPYISEKFIAQAKELEKDI